MFFIKNKNYIFLIIIYILILGYCLYIAPLTSNDIWNYGFSYGIVKGEVLYRDFNLVIGPFYPLFMSIPLFVSNSYLSYLVFHAFIVLSFLVLLLKMYDRKVIFAVILFVAFPTLIMPSYNSFIIFLIVLLAFLEKSDINNKDIIIGIILAIAFFTKQNIGILLLLPSLFFRKKVHIKRRMLGFMIPTVFILLYLFYTRSFLTYIDLCFLGLFDFSNHNRLIIPSCIVIFTVLIVVSIILLIKNHKNLAIYYYLLGYFILFPIVNYFHLYYVLFLFVIVLFDVVEFNFLRVKKVYYLCHVLLFSIIIIEILPIINNMNFCNDFNHFQYKYISIEQQEYSNMIISYLKDKDFTIYADVNYFYKIVMNRKLDSLDIVNYGNSGYGGSHKLLSNIKKNRNKFYLIPYDINFKYAQIDKNGYDYIINNAVKIDRIGEFDVYKFNEKEQ